MTLESEIGLYETDYIFVSSGYPPRVKVGWTSWIFLRSQLPGLTGFVSAPASGGLNTINGLECYPIYIGVKGEVSWDEELKFSWLDKVGQTTGY